MKKLFSFFFLIIYLFIFVWNSVITTNAFTQASNPKQSEVLGIDDILRSVDHNKIVLDIQRSIIDINWLKNYVDSNLASVWSMDWWVLVYNRKNVYFSQNLLVAWTLRTNRIIIPDWWLKDNVIIWETFKDRSITANKLHPEVFWAVEETFKLSWINAYYDEWNVWIWTNSPDSKLVVNWNIKILWEWNGVLFADWTKQTDMIVDDSNNVKIFWDQTISWEKKFLTSIELSDWLNRVIGITNTIPLQNRSNFLVTENAIKQQIDANTVNLRINGICWTSHNQIATTTPTDNLCSQWVASSITNANNIYNWSCSGENGWFTSQCRALTPINWVCGSDNWQEVEEVVNFCSSWVKEIVAWPPVPVIPKSYDFTTHTFTNCWVSWRHWPTLAQCRTAYSSAAWTANFNFFNQANYQWYQLWTVPETWTYTIRVAWARWGTWFSWNAYTWQWRIVEWTFSLTKDEKIIIVVWQMGQDRNGSSHHGGWGGGASWVFRWSSTNTNISNLLVVWWGWWWSNAYHTYWWSWRYAWDWHWYANINAWDISRTWWSYQWNWSSFSQWGVVFWKNAWHWDTAQPFTQGLIWWLQTNCYSTFGWFGWWGTPHCHNGAGWGWISGWAWGNNQVNSWEGWWSFVNTAVITFWTTFSLDRWLNNDHWFVTITKTSNTWPIIEEVFWKCNGINWWTSSPTCSATIKPAELYPFTSHTFTNCWKVWQNWPTLAQCRTHYTSTEANWWKNNTLFYNNTNGIQLWTVPKDWRYEITTRWAAGWGWNNISNLWWYWAEIKSVFTLNKDTKLQILVWQSWDQFEWRTSWVEYFNGGWWWTYVSILNAIQPLLVSWWGWGCYWNSNSNRQNASLTTSPNETTAPSWIYRWIGLNAPIWAWSHHWSWWGGWNDTYLGGDPWLYRW
jgi:hypothetical protein